jgi:hypothetical protein
VIVISATLKILEGVKDTPPTFGEIKDTGCEGKDVKVAQRSTRKLIGNAEPMVLDLGQVE